MNSLRRITTRYIPAEDRIRLSGQTLGGDAVTLWLTQRLLMRLLPNLLQWVGGKEGDGPQAEAVQSFKQAAARASLEPQAPVPVRAGNDQAAWLVMAVDLQVGPKGVRLTFRGQGQRLAMMTLAAQALRQWLNILHDAWRTAGWPLVVWPEWMLEAAPLAGRRRSTVVH